MNENDYERLVLKTINTYTILNENTLKEMTKEVNDVLDKHAHALCEDPSKELIHWKVSNPSVPRLYALPKNHKPLDEEGDMKMRPIASNNAPTEKWN